MYCTVPTGAVPYHTRLISPLLHLNSDSTVTLDCSRCGRWHGMCCTTPHTVNTATWTINTILVYYVVDLIFVGLMSTQIPSITRDTLLPLSVNNITSHNTNNTINTNSAINTQITHHNKPSESGQFEHNDYNDLLHHNTELQSSNEFLQHYIIQCESQLARYQQLHPELLQTINTTNVPTVNPDDIPPWLVNSKVMSPLLVAYESRVIELTQINHQLQSDHNILQQQIEELLHKNESLENELELNIKQLMTQLDSVTSTQQNNIYDNTNNYTGDGSASVLYQQQIDQLKSNELQLQHELNTCKLQYDTQLDNIQQQYNKSIASLKSENISLLRQVEDHKKNQKTFESLRSELQSIKHQYTQQNHSLIELQSRYDTLQRLNDTLSDKLSTQSQFTENINNELQRCINALTISEQTANKYKDNEISIISQMNDNMDKCTVYCNERDTAIAQLHTKDIQIQNLMNKLQELSDDAKQHEEKQLSALYQSSKDTEQKLLAEIKSLELQCIEFELTRDSMQVQLQHDTQTFNKQIQQLHDNNDKLKYELNLLNNKYIELQSHNTVNTGETQRLNIELQRKLDIATKQKKVHADQYNDIKSHYDILEQKYISIHTQYNTIQSQLDTVTNESIKQKRLHTTIVQKLESRLSDVDARKLLDHKSYQHRLHELQQSYQHKESKLTQLVEQHSILADKYKHENNTNLQYFTKTINEYRDKYSTLQSVYNALEPQYNELQQRYDLLLQQYHSLQSQYHSIKDNLNHLDNDNDELTRNNSQLQSRCDRLEIELDRLKRSSDSYHRKQLSGIHDTKLPLPSDITNIYQHNNNMITNKQATVTT